MITCLSILFIYIYLLENEDNICIILIENALHTDFKCVGRKTIGIKIDLDPQSITYYTVR